MRNPDGNGAYCDSCRRYCNPFTYYTIKCQKTEKGDKYPDVTSDYRYRTIDHFHYCKDCYDKVIRMLNAIQIPHV